MRIHSNIVAMSAVRLFGQHNAEAAKSIFRISSGKKLPFDDLASISVSARLRSRIRELDVMVEKTEQAMDHTAIVSGEAMGRQDMLSRINELSLQLNSDTNTMEEKKLIALEVKELSKELEHATLQETGMEIVAVGNGSPVDELLFKKGDKVYYDGQWLELKKLLDSGELQTLDGEPIDEPNMEESGKVGQIKEPEEKVHSLTEHVDALMKDNLQSFAVIGANANSLSSRLDRLLSEQENAIGALSLAEDIDIAKEYTNFVKETILAQVAAAMAAQANALPRNVLALLDTG
jgi:flagellin-like hook-associated protein FlgL